VSIKIIPSGTHIPRYPMVRFTTACRFAPWSRRMMKERLYEKATIGDVHGGVMGIISDCIKRA